MHVKILGTRGNIDISAPHYAKQSGVLIDSKIMLDIGEKEFLTYSPAAIFITHLHEDHAFFVKNASAQIQMPVFVPEAYGSREIFDMISHTVKIDGYSITPLPVMHSRHVRSVGYLVEHRGKRLFYSGDVAEFDGRILDKFGRMDAIITEASFIRRGGMIRDKASWPQGHLGIPDLIELFARFTKHIIFMHFGSWFVSNPEEGIRKIKELETGTIKLDVAHDGSEFIV